MASIAFGAIGGVIGKQAIGTAIGASLGRLAFSALGSLVDNALFGSDKNTSSEGRRITDVNFQHSAYGHMIPITYGTFKLAGNIIWASPLRELPKTTSQTMGGKGGKVRHSHTSYDYMISLAICLCEGPISKIGRIYADGRLLDQSLYDIHVYTGREDQLPDACIESHMGIGNTPAYRGLAYVVIRNLHLLEFNNRIPDFSFEVTRELHSLSHFPTPEQMIGAVTIIPGAGEFVYDTVVQQKLEGDYMGENFAQRGYREYINNHNAHNRANVSIAMDDMQQTLPNLRWVAPVVSWFVTSEDLQQCNVLPGVEVKTNIRTVPNEWGVGKYNRYNAHLIGRTNKKPRYGGTPSDSSILNMLGNLRARGLKIMFYPMPFVDSTHKPWRGRLSGDAHSVAQFFTKENGYNQFIIHYAHLVKGMIDAFVIGSELIGLTKVRASDGSFPAVNELIALAKTVKQILGPDVKITYAADWSEYHHTDHGWYNLDPLWASDAIDVVGIDAYFPLTEGKNQNDILNKALRGWDSGECYDYYYEDEARTKRAVLAPAYAIKNITWWWENDHYNPDGKKTVWQPGSKKIWFTEYGFPSVDGATNQPNVFYDPTSAESAMPRDSNHAVSFNAQRAGLCATELRWRNSHIVENKFVWTWDARPYPEWPDYTDVWADSGCWQRGHWLQGKLNVSEIGQVVEDLCRRANLNPDQYDISGLNSTVQGILINRQNSCKDIVAWLRSAFIFEVAECEGVLHFDNRQQHSKLQILQSDMLPANANDVFVLKRADTKSLPSEVCLNYIDKHTGYQVNTARAKHHMNIARRKLSISLPLVLENDQARHLAETLLHLSWLESSSYSFFLPTQYYHLAPGDVVHIEEKNKFITMRITKIIFGKNKALYVEAVPYCGDVTALQKVRDPQSVMLNSLKRTPQTILEIMDVKLLPHEISQGRLLMAAVGTGSNWKGASVFANFYGEEKLVAEINEPSIIGTCITAPALASPLLLDRKSKIVVNLIQGELTSATAEEFNAGKNLALIDDEIIQFRYARLINSNQYELSHLVRGKFGSALASSIAGHRFVLLDKAVSVDVPNELLGSTINFKYISNGHNTDMFEQKSCLYKAECLKPLAPAHIACTPNDEGLLLTWVRRSRIGAWRSGVDVAIAEEVERYQVEVYKNDELIIRQETSQALLQINNTKLGTAKLKVKIWQISAAAGLGECIEAELHSKQSKP